MFPMGTTVQNELIITSVNIIGNHKLMQCNCRISLSSNEGRSGIIGYALHFI